MMMTTTDWERRAFPWARRLVLVGVCFFAADFTAATIEKHLSAGAPPVKAAAQPAMTRSNVPQNGLAYSGELQYVLNNTVPIMPVGGGNASMPGMPAGANGTTVAVANAPPPAALPKLTGTLAGSGHALAVLQSGEDTRVAAVGEEVNGYVVVEVGQYSAVLRGPNGQTYNLSMDLAASPGASNTTAPAAAPSPTNTVPPVPNAMPPAVPPADGTISSAQIREMLDHSERFLPHISLKPIRRGEEVVGVQVNYNNPNNPFAMLGVNTGDIITSFNGKPLTGAQDLTWAYQELRNATTLNLQLERNGQPVPLSVHLSDR